MRKAIGLLVVLLIVGLLVMFIRQDDSANESIGSTEFQLPSPNSSSNDPKMEKSNYTLGPIELEQLQADIDAANTAVEVAEAKLDGLSEQLDLVEAQVHDIEARGDNPAEYAEEVMPYMQPVLDEFLDAEAALDEALERQQEATSAMKEAIQRR